MALIDNYLDIENLADNNLFYESTEGRSISMPFLHSQQLSAHIWNRNLLIWQCCTRITL